jgi:hypothetical protein
LPGTHTAHSSNLRSDDRFLSYVELVWIFVGLVVFFDGSSSWGGGGVSLFSSFHFCSGVNSICNGLPTQQPVRDTLDFPSENHVCHAA